MRAYGLKYYDIADKNLISTLQTELLKNNADLTFVNEHDILIRNNSTDKPLNQYSPETLAGFDEIVVLFPTESLLIRQTAQNIHEAQILEQLQKVIEPNPSNTHITIVNSSIHNDYKQDDLVTPFIRSKSAQLTTLSDKKITHDHEPVQVGCQISEFAKHIVKGDAHYRMY
jgi:hypothetical protein